MRWVMVVLVALTTLLAAPAYAQSIPRPPATKPSPAEEAAAKRNFDSGTKLFGEGAYAEALITFEQAYRVSGRPGVLRSIAQCHRSLKHFVEAYEAYEQMLTAHEAQLSAADKTAVKQVLEELAVLTGTLLVNASETDAEIEIDGKSVGRSPMPKPKRVQVAAHQVRVTKSSFAPYEKSVNVGSQDNVKVDVKLELEKTTGKLSIREQGAREVHVVVDGEDKGPAPWEGDVAAGEHTIEAKGPRFAAESRKVRIAAKERVDVVLDAQPTTGHLRVTTVPASASISIDGKSVGTGSWDGDLPEGSHRVEVSLPGEPPHVRDVTLGRGQTVVQEIPIVSAIVGPRFANYRGIYVKLNLDGHLGGAASNAKAGFTEAADDGGAFGAALALRIGHAWDWYAAEFVSQLMFHHTSDNTKFTDASGQERKPRTESNDINYFFGVGPRVTSKDETVRFTFGIAPGIAIRNFSVNRNGNDTGDGDRGPTSNGFQQGGSSQQSDQGFKRAGYTTLGFVADGGILLGSTPGTKFFIGVNAWIDFPPGDVIVGPDTVSALPNDAFRAPGRGIIVVDSVQFYVGPTIGLQFGH